MIHRLLFNVLLILSLGYAAFRGGAPERAGASIILAGDLLTIALQRAYADRFGSVGLAVLLVDAAMFAAFFVLALKANRFWPLWITALQGVTVMVHGAIALSAGAIPWAYAFGLAIWSYPILLLLAAATHRHRARLRTYGADPSWSSFSPGMPTILPPPPMR